MSETDDDAAAGLVECSYVLARLFQSVDDTEKAEKELSKLEGLPLKQAIQGIKRVLQYRVIVRKKEFKNITKLPLPLIFESLKGGWIILAAQSEGMFLIQRPGGMQPEVANAEVMESLWSGRIAILSAPRSLSELAKKFDIRWFIPELMRHKMLGSEIILASAVIQALGLVSPIFFQIIMDKVIVHRTTSTLTVMVLALVGIAFLEAVLQFARQYTATRTACRVDARLGGKLFRHLVDLPISYFKARPVGITVMRVCELNTIREFITGASSTIILDVTFSGLFLFVMYLYSPFLTGVASLSILSYILIAVFITGPLQVRTEEMYRDAAANCSFLTETITGIETVKTLALEPQMLQRWETQTRNFVLSNYKVQRLMHLSGVLIQATQKFTMVVILWLGARMVIDLELTIGQLIAFNMLSNQLGGPIIRLANLWPQAVRAKISIDRIGDVINTIPEIQKTNSELDWKIKGHIDFNDVTFSYGPDSPPILQQFNLTIPEKAYVAFVGPSGSGKSTLARLMQKLYVPNEGEVFLDGRPLSSLNAAELRKRIGVVPQESFLFNRSVRENISLYEPSLSLTPIVEAAKKAGAHEFIVELTDGYDTVLSEGGTSLSGGQRQRISIARALVSDPAILILDEATSALDDHSQAIIQNNLHEIRQERTVIVIAHRLSTVRDCDCIYVLAEGRIQESGTHDELLARGGAYRRLWDLQRANLGLEPDSNRSTPSPGYSGEDYNQELILGIE